MSQIHKRLTAEQVKTIFQSYLRKEITSLAVREKLEIGKTRFFALLKKYQSNPESFTLHTERSKPTNQISESAESKILKELQADKALIDNRDIPIRDYNYSALRDNLLEQGVKVSLPTIINRAKQHGFYLRRKKQKKIHDREVLTNFVGELVQHDSSYHQFSPYMHKKLYLITSLDDHSRLLLFADLFEREGVWRHITSLKSLVLQYGCPLRYYTDQHSIFRFIRERDKNSLWYNVQKQTDDVDPQFKQVLQNCGIGITYALSPQAKGKVERPYRWIQDRLVRTAAKEQIDNLTDLRTALKKLVYLYNNKWIHSTTKEIPIVRFENALSDQRCLFKPIQLTQPYCLDDAFCLRIERTVDIYRSISLDGMKLKIPNGEPREKVRLNIVPDPLRGFAVIRFWQRGRFLGDQKIKLENLRWVHF